MVRAGTLRDVCSGRASAAVYGAAAGDAYGAGAGWRSALAAVRYVRGEKWARAFGGWGSSCRQCGIFRDWALRIAARKRTAFFGELSGAYRAARGSCVGDGDDAAGRVRGGGVDGGERRLSERGVAKGDGSGGADVFNAVFGAACEGGI